MFTNWLLFIVRMLFSCFEREITEICFGIAKSLVPSVHHEATVPLCRNMQVSTTPHVLGLCMGASRLSPHVTRANVHILRSNTGLEDALGSGHGMFRFNTIDGDSLYQIPTYQLSHDNYDTLVRLRSHSPRFRGVTPGLDHVERNPLRVRNLPDPFLFFIIHFKKIKIKSS